VAFSDPSLFDSNAALAAGAQSVTITGTNSGGPNLKGIAFGLQHA
jgi:hypothetical protein